MTRDILVVCLTAAKMIERVRGVARYDIPNLIQSVPSLKILSGDPSVAVSVEIDHARTNDLKRAVDGVCTVAPDAKFKPLAKAGRPLE